MDWSRFKLHGDAPERAFEALTGTLFERWCHREYAGQIRRVVFVNGAGGDGGVEAYTQLKDDQVIGLQAKWFREPLKSSQIEQIRKSLKTASDNRSGLSRYIVTIPRDLSDAKTEKRQTKTERDRWDNFIKESNQQYPHIAIDLWGETQITQLLAELGSEGLRRYWFEGSFVDVNYLNLQFKRAESGWLTPRYSPDLHQSGQIESDLQLRLNGLASRPKWLSEVSQICILLEQAHRAVLRLRRYPEFMQRDDADALIKGTEAWLISAIAQQQELEKRLTPGNRFPLPNLEDEVIDVAATRQLINVLLNDNVSLHWGSSASTTSDISKQLKHTLERWKRRKVTPQKLQELGQPAAYIGKPGVGKTHALADAVRQHLEKGKPAILLRAKDIDLSKSWDPVLAEAVGESGWNLRQVLDALETAAIQAEVQATVNITDDSEFKPVRVLVAIDGLDETSRAERWAEKLGELLPLAKEYPRILFVCSLRTSLYSRLSIPKDISQVWLSGSDAPLEDLFASYCKVNRIECPPILRWALKTPLAIRLFADLYQGQHIDSVTLQEFSLVTLIRQKIDHTERVIRENDPKGWTDKITPVHDTLRGIVKTCLAEGKAISQVKALQVAEAAQKTPGILSTPQLSRILDNCLNHGLLLLKRQPSDDPLEPDLLLWEPAYETLTDFLLAWESYNSAKTDPATPTMPTYLKDRENAIVLTVYLLGKEGYDFFATGLWANDLSEQKREELRLRTILMMPPKQGLAYQDWVVELFQRNMPSCRKVLERLVIPGLRIPGYFYGAKFIHDTLLPMQVAKRDLFWSGPDYLPANHGAPWEGLGTPVLDELEIADDDPWDAAPLLLAWATTTVKNNLRRRIRAQLAVWGSNKPNELLNLLKCACLTNDPQMREDILSAAYGASCLTRPDGEWLQLCNWIIDNFFVPNTPLYTHDVIVLHSAKSMIERCVICQVPVDEDRLVYVRHPHVDLEELLPIDREAAIEANKHLVMKRISYYLNRYVLSRPIKRFFDKSILLNTHRNDSKQKEVKEEDADNIENIDKTILYKFVEGSLRQSAEPEARQRVENFLIRKAIDQGIMTAFDSATDEEQSELLQGWGITEEETEEKELAEVHDEVQLQPESSPSAQALLSRYIAQYNLQELTPRNLAFGFVAAYTNQLGWSEDIFRKTPNGGKPGEIIGADISIARQYTPATHGSRSSIATFAEKYVWEATNELTGFLADRLDAYTWDKCFKHPVNIGLFTEKTNPASDVGYRQLNINEFLDFSELIPDTNLSETVQVDRANEWVNKAPIPDAHPLLLLSSEQLPEWAGNHAWVVLRSFAIERHTDSQAESVLRASSFLFPSNTLLLIEEDFQFKVLPDLYEVYSGIVSGETYVDPCEVAWNPWIQEAEGLIDYSTLDIAGQPVRFDIQAATCQFYWEAPNNETELWMPAKKIRQALGIVDFCGGKLLSASGEVLAFTLNCSGERWLVPHGKVLVVRQDAMLEMLEQENLSMGWGVWINREPAYPLNDPLNVASRKRMLRNWRAVVFWKDDGLKTVTYQDVIEPWNKD